MGSYNNDVSLSFDAQPGLTAPQHRRPVGPGGAPAPGFGYPAAGPAPFQQQQQPYNPGVPMGQPPGTAPNMAFMSFDLSNTGGFPPPPRVGGNVGMSSYGSSASLGSAYFDDEPPLLEELGINIPQIVRKTTSAFNPLHVNADLFEDGELSGPIMFLMCFGFFQLLAGKVHFGVILGWSATSSFLIWGVVNLMNGGDVQMSGIELYRCCSLFGYSLLPMVAFSALALFLSHKGILILVVAAATVAWCARSCSTLLLALSPQSDDFKLLVLYLCILIYCAFALLIVF